MSHAVSLTSTLLAYPDRTIFLDTAESAFLVALRWWVAGYRGDKDPVPRLCRGFKTAGARDAAFCLNDFMAVVARTARQPIAIHQPRCPLLSADEQHMLFAASVAQTGERARAERALCATLLLDVGAEFALAPLVTLGELFAKADLIFSLRRPPIDESLLAAAVSPVHSVLGATIH